MDSNASSIQLTAQLNSLLYSLNIPIKLESPVELTPSLLIVVLEALLESRIPLLLRDTHGKCSLRTYNVQKTKIFLGVLEHDILQTDVGLSSIDPRRLAEGSWDEVVFVGELLCWIGRRAGLKAVPNYVSVGSPSGSTATATTKRTNATHFSSFKESATESITSVGIEDQVIQTDSNSSSSESLSFLPTFTSPAPLPRCIHEVPSPALLFTTDLASEPDESVDVTLLTSQHTFGSNSVRYSGYIQPVDEDFELTSFESSRITSSSSGSQSRVDLDDLNDISIITAKHANEYVRTIELLKERARLLGELAVLKKR
ncbi:hypothetical protein BDQ12DRAFT_675932 [Crucibulum laeve]|uniref:Uncharacterized protein n=1 Tax=Crucibulum laeve TaxID=68775 RepID=A0A5C3MF07_9AGAR|nr:hypothetical protein BDQ12DRAFT_675932 [Crucibulum laeve]